MLLKDKVAIVTGGTRGIGYAIVQGFLKEGAKVVLCGSKPESAQKAVESLKAENADWEVTGISPDLADYEAVKEAFTEVHKTYGKIDILVNNAGVSESHPFLSYTPELFKKVMDLNVFAVFNCSHVAAEFMAEQKNGVILSTSSMVSRDAQPSGMAYPTSKFAVNGMTLSLARELGPLGIRVNAVAPGITNTDMVRVLPKEVIDPLIQRIPLHRVGEPEDIANAFVFLASDKASYVTGHVLFVDGQAHS